jgi:hypothetical protein
VVDGTVAQHYKISYSLLLSTKMETQTQLNSFLNFLSSNVTFTATYPCHQDRPAARNYLNDSAITHDASCPVVQIPVLCILVIHFIMRADHSDCAV